MTKKKFNEYTDHIWKYREYLFYIEQFEYPFYGGLKNKFDGSVEACDAMQLVWCSFIDGEFKTKKQFQKAYKNELKMLGEDVK